MTGAEFGQPQRQIPITLQAAVIDLDVGRAIHGLDRELTILRAGHEHIVGKLGRVTRFLPQRQIDQRRRMDFLIAFAIQPRPNIVGNLQIDLPAPIVPEDHARRLFLNMKEILLAGDQAMIALLGLFEKSQMGL